MSYRPLPNYLRTARRRSGFSQAEIAFLLGSRSGTNVSRHETSARTPSVSMVFAYEVIFRAPARDLFAGAYERVQHSIVERTKLFLEELEAGSRRPLPATKVEVLRAIVEGAERGDGESR